MGIVFQFSDNSSGIFHVCSYMWKNMGVKDENHAEKRPRELFSDILIVLLFAAISELTSVQ